MFDWVLNTSLGWVISRWLIKENSALTLLPIEVTLEYHPKFLVFRIFLMDSSYLNLQEMQINIAIGRVFTKVKNLLWRCSKRCQTSTQPAIIYSKLTKETLKQGVKYVQS